MKGPFEYQRHGPPREISSEDGERLYLKEGLVFAIFGMEMWRTMVSEVHSNHNSKKPGDLGHFFFRFYPSTPAAREAPSARGNPSAIVTPGTHSFAGRPAVSGVYQEDPKVGQTIVFLWSAEPAPTSLVDVDGVYRDLSVWWTEGLHLSAKMYQNRNHAALRPDHVEPGPDEWSAVHPRHEANGTSSGGGRGALSESGRPFPELSRVGS